MVRNIKSFGFLIVLAGVLSFAGCEKANSPVLPLEASPQLLISVPGPGVGASTVPLYGEGALRYNLTCEGAAPVTGTLIFSDISKLGVIGIPLPKNGHWLVSVELFEGGGKRGGMFQAKLDGFYPAYIGADLVEVRGTTRYTLDMGSLQAYCYYGYLSATACPSFSGNDRYTFDTGQVSTGTGGNIQVLRNASTDELYLAGVAGAKIAYLGNGDLVDHTSIPSDVVFYANSRLAKAAALGSALEALAFEDVFLVEISPTNHVWFQVGAVVNLCGDYGSVSFVFRMNDDGFPYLKFDETQYGRDNCNQNSIPQD